MSRTIRIKGIGKATKKPDYVVISMSIESQDKDYEKVINDLTEKINKLTECLTNIGFSEDCIKTNNFNVSPCYRQVQKGDFDYENVFDGYLATYDLKLEFSLYSKKFSEVIDTISKSGVYTSFVISFKVNDLSSVTDDILRTATINAKQKARVLCEAAGERLGKLISIEYDCQNYNLKSSFEIACENGNPMMARNLNVSPDEINISDVVIFEWELQ